MEPPASFSPSVDTEDAGSNVTAPRSADRPQYQ